MGSRVRIRLFHILHFVIDVLLPLLKNSKSGVYDRGHRFRSGSPRTNYPHATSIIDAHQWNTHDHLEYLLTAYLYGANTKPKA